MISEYKLGRYSGGWYPLALFNLIVSPATWYSRFIPENGWGWKTPSWWMEWGIWAVAASLREDGWADDWLDWYSYHPKALIHLGESHNKNQSSVVISGLALGTLWRILKNCLTSYELKAKCIQSKDYCYYYFFAEGSILPRVSSHEPRQIIWVEFEHNIIFKSMSAKKSWIFSVI